MLICHCHGISDRRIKETIGQGARTVAQVARACGAASGCGGCAAAVAELVEESRFRALPTFSAQAGYRLSDTYRQASTPAQLAAE